MPGDRVKWVYSQSHKGAVGKLSISRKRRGPRVTKEELLQAVWPDTFVQESVLKTCVPDIRKALGDNSKDPKHIDTVHRRGYRFLVEAAAQAPPPPQHPGPPANPLIGRSTALKSLRSMRQFGAVGGQSTRGLGEPGHQDSVLMHETGRLAPVVWRLVP